MADIKFETPFEHYLNENYGNLNQYYQDFTAGASVSEAFYRALSTPDRYRLKTKGYMTTSGEVAPRFCSASGITEAIQFLESTKSDYPEDHPIWGVR